MRQHCANAAQVAHFLQTHPLVQRVHYPGVAGHRQFLLATQQMKGYGGMISFEIEGGREAANAFFRSLRVFSFAESLGGVESLACYPAEMTHGAIPREERERRGITEGLIRLSVGIEDSEDLLADLSGALAAAESVTLHAEGVVL